jgi:lipid A 3-O-deacylase
LIRSIVAFLLLSCVGVFAAAQSSSFAISAPAQSTGAAKSAAQLHTAASPVADVREHQRWEMGPFVNWGNGFGNRDQYRFLSAGFELGKVLTPVLHAGIFSGQFEYAGNIMPLWMAFTPAAHQALYDCSGTPCYYPVGGGNFYGASLTPVIFRWNFLTHSRRIQPWFQAAGGLIYTTHKFPPDILVQHGKPGGTSVWNFSPQGGGGIHYFVRPRRSIDLGVNGVHISSASLGDKNPGVNASIQIQVGYTIWK